MVFSLVRGSLGDIRVRHSWTAARSCATGRRVSHYRADVCGVLGGRRRCCRHVNKPAEEENQKPSDPQIALTSDIKPERPTLMKIMFLGF